jgi:hypothetical protein
MNFKKCPAIISCLLLPLVSYSASEVLEGPNHGNKLYLTQEKAGNLLQKVRLGSRKIKLSKAKIKNLLGNSEINLSNKDLTQQCDNDELSYLEIERKLIRPFFSSLDKPSLSKFISSNFETNFMAQPDKKSINLSPGKYFKIQRNSKFKNDSSVFKKYFSSFKEVTWSEVKGLRIYSNKDQRSEKDLDILAAQVTVRVDIRGEDKAGKLRNDKLDINLNIEKLTGEWKVSRLNFLNGKSIVSNKSQPFFTNLTASASKDSSVKTYRRSEAIRRGGYAMSLGDYNKDGDLDIYVGQVGKAQLFTYKDQKITEIKPKGLAFEGLAKSSAFVDFNQDGYEDLMVVRFVPPAQQGSKQERPVVIYQNNKDGSFTKVPYKKLANGLSTSKYAMPSAIGDLNGDGKNDFYIGYPGVRDFTHMVANEYNSEVQGLYYNGGDFQFRDATKKIKVSTDRPEYLYPHSSVALDYDRDGDLDLLVIDDRNNLSPAYENDGKGNFRQVNKIKGLNNGGYAMSVDAGDLNGDGVTDLIVSNVESGASQRIGKSCQANWGIKHRAYREEPLNVYFGSRNGYFTRANVEQLGLKDVGEGLAGIRILDFNNDGLQDIYVTNGLWSGTDPQQDLGSFFAIMQNREGHNISSIYKYDQNRHHNQSLFMDILSFYKGDVYNGVNGSSRPSLSGFQRNRMFQNLGNGEFVDVAHMAGLDSISDGYMVATHDIDKDGKLDLILRNGDPGSKDVNFPSLEIFQNNHKTKNHSLTLKLVGTKSNTDAIGALVEVKSGENSQIGQVIGLHGTVQSSRELSFGLGKDRLAKKVIIRWPSGKDTILRNLKAGRHVIVESQQVDRDRVSKN